MAATYAILQCSICDRQVRVDQTTDHPILTKCNITNSCRGSLTKVGESNLRGDVISQFKLSDGLTPWVQRKLASGTYAEYFTADNTVNFTGATVFVTTKSTDLLVLNDISVSLDGDILIAGVDWEKIDSNTIKLLTTYTKASSTLTITFLTVTSDTTAITTAIDVNLISGQSTGYRFAFGVPTSQAEETLDITLLTIDGDASAQTVYQFVRGNGTTIITGADQNSQVFQYNPSTDRLAVEVNNVPQAASAFIATVNTVTFNTALSVEKNYIKITVATAQTPVSSTINCVRKRDVQGEFYDTSWSNIDTFILNGINYEVFVSSETTFISDQFYGLQADSGVILLLSNYPYASVDRRLDMFVNLNNLTDYYTPIFTPYTALEIDSSLVTLAYPPIQLADPITTDSTGTSVGYATTIPTSYIRGPSN